MHSCIYMFICFSTVIFYIMMLWLFAATKDVYKSQSVVAVSPMYDAGKR